MPFFAWAASGAFQHTAARRRLLRSVILKKAQKWVSTHSRAEAAAKEKQHEPENKKVSTHSRAEAAAQNLDDYIYEGVVSTHSRAEAAAVCG